MNIDEVRRYALGLPQTTEEPHHKYTSFRVNGKIFATAPPEETHLHVFVDETRRELALVAHPEACEKLWWGKKVVGVRVSLATAQPSDVEDLLSCAWRRKAPKKLVNALPDE